jgi:plastocyanin
MKLLQPSQQRSAAVRAWRPAALGLLAATSLLMAACGGGDNSDTGTQAASKPASTPAPNTSGSAGGLSLAPKGDQLMFDASNLNAKAGKVTINFTNDSSLTHDVVLINSSNKILGQTPEFDGGTKSFNATLKPGTYTYYCSVPGHREAGMQGTLTVK